MTDTETLINEVVRECQAGIEAARDEGVVCGDVMNVVVCDMDENDEP